MAITSSALSRIAHDRVLGAIDPDEREAVRELARDARRTAAELRMRAHDTVRLSAAIHERTLETRRTAEALVADALAITHVSATLRDGGFTSRCAWCGRYRVGDRWLPVRRSRLVGRCETTHGICDDCLAGLRRDGRST